MDNLTLYLPIGLLAIAIGGLITVKVSLKDRPTFHQARKLFMDKGICEERSGNFEKKLDEISQDVKELLVRNGGARK